MRRIEGEEKSSRESVCVCGKESGKEKKSRV